MIEIGDRAVVETRTGETFEGHTLVAADGANSVVACSLGLRRGKNLAAAIETETPVPGKLMAAVCRCSHVYFWIRSK